MLVRRAVSIGLAMTGSGHLAIALAANQRSIDDTIGSARSRRHSAFYAAAAFRAARTLKCFTALVTKTMPAAGIERPFFHTYYRCN
jgi:hypothetical protein